VFDLWVQAWRQKRAHGDVVVVRFGGRHAGTDVKLISHREGGVHRLLVRHASGVRCSSVAGLIKIARSLGSLPPSIRDMLNSEPFP